MNGTSASRPSRARVIGWCVLLSCVAVLLVLGARPATTSGASDDRLFALAGELKCLQCVGESVATSQASIAVKMRDEIRVQMRAGRSDDEILTYFADRYSQRVLLTPASTGAASVVWIVPVVVMVAGIGVLIVIVARSRRRRSDAGDHVISQEDRDLVAAALTPATSAGADETVDGDVNAD